MWISSDDWLSLPTDPIDFQRTLRSYLEKSALELHQTAVFAHLVVYRTGDEMPDFLSLLDQKLGTRFTRVFQYSDHQEVVTSSLWLSPLGFVRFDQESHRSTPLLSVGFLASRNEEGALFGHGTEILKDLKKMTGMQWTPPSEPASM